MHVVCKLTMGSSHAWDANCGFPRSGVSAFRIRSALVAILATVKVYQKYKSPPKIDGDTTNKSRHNSGERDRLNVVACPSKIK